jgi:hypothetical protein
VAQAPRSGRKEGVEERRFGHLRGTPRTRLAFQEGLAREDHVLTL